MTTETFVNGLEISSDGNLCLTSEHLSKAGFRPGDQLAVMINRLGQIIIQKSNVTVQPLSREELSDLLKQAFKNTEYNQREKVISLIREVRQEMADDRE